MILKEADSRSFDLEELMRLRDSSPRSFRASIQKQINNLRAGIAGERDAAHFLNREFGSKENVCLLHDLRLGLNGDFAQIDHLLIHRVQRAIWVLETKNYSGRLSCDEHGDWTVWRNNKPMPIASPTNQARRQCVTLRLWLERHGYGAFNRIHPVVLISPSSSVNRTQLPRGCQIVKSDNFGSWWEKQTDEIGLGTAIGMVGRHVLDGLSREDFIAFGQSLADAHVPAKTNWRAKLRLPRGAVPDDGPNVRQTDNPPPELGDSAQDVPAVVSTAHGEVTISRIPDGRYALRNEKNDALIELVRNACRGKARWNPRFKNWLIESSELPAVLSVLGAQEEGRS